jgi:lipoprotein-anchoring transpeptidase ErfK/SrfK
VRRHQKYQLPDSRNAPPSGFYWLLVLVALAAVAWIWWHAARTPERKSVAPKLPPARQLAKSQPAAMSRGMPRIPSTNAAIPGTNGVPGRPVQNILEAQLALERRGISPGSLDGLAGSQTRAALRAFQQQEKLPLTGELDAGTKSRLLLTPPLYTTCTITTNDLARLQPLGKTWLGKSQQTALDYETILELVAEKSHAHPGLIRRLNPNVDWTNVVAGTVLQVPEVARDEAPAKAAFIEIHLADKVLEAFDEDTNLLAHFPCSIAQRVEKRPVGELRVAVIAPDPNYTFDPELFPESAEARQLNMKLMLRPGPNNPVGTVWIGLDKPGYGMHGTPNPEQVGRTESHGCFRLANWNAEYLLKLVWIGLPVYVEP